EEFERVENVREQRRIHEFLVMLDANVQKVSAFYEDKFAEVDARFTALRVDRYKRKEGAVDHGASMMASSKADVRAHLTPYQIEWLDLFNEVDHLRDFCKLNFTAFVKGLKKWDKNTRIPLQEEYCEWIEASQPFYKDSSCIEDLQGELEVVYSQLFCAGDVSRAAQILSEYSRGATQISTLRRTMGGEGGSNVIAVTRAINWNVTYL
ncbi:hypothetical protein KIPB_012245, partial [Kipferlia bialata]